MKHTTHPFAAALALALLAAAPLARADLAPPPPPAACAGQPDGTACVRFDGTAGVCTTRHDARRPGRDWVTCEADAHECDRLAVGAACHGYLNRPAHCREFTNDRTHERWRACQVDESAYTSDAANANSAPPNSAPPNSAPPNSAPRPAARTAGSARGCAVGTAGGGRAGGVAWIALAGIAAAVVARRRRRA